LEVFYSQEAYPDKLRRIRYFVAEQNKRLIFLSNYFTLTALAIAELLLTLFDQRPEPVVPYVGIQY